MFRPWTGPVSRAMPERRAIGWSVLGALTMRRQRRVALAVATLTLIGIGLSWLPSGDDLDTDFPPPRGSESYRDLLPARIAGNPASIRILVSSPQLFGARADYGMDATIDIVFATVATDFDAFVRERIRPRLDAYEDRASEQLDGTWRLRGRGRSGRLHAWQNHRWLFVIEARSEAAFDEAVDRFAYIARRRS